MTGLFSAISGQFGKAIVVGALLPALVFIVVAHLFIVPMLPWEWRLITRIAILDAQWTLAVATLATIVLAGLLYVLNIPILRLYEGYFWQYSLAGKWRTAHWRRKQWELRERRTRAQAARVVLRQANPKNHRIAKLKGVRDAADLTLLSEYPGPAWILPTRFGNVMRSFEVYPDDQYGIEAIVLWPRFIARVRSEHAAALDSAKTELDVVVNFSFLSIAAAVLMIAAFLIYPVPLASGRLLAWFVFRVAAALLLGWFFYVAAIGRAAAWGDLVRSVFDLYRGDVLRDLGFTEKPRDLASEKALWSAISIQMMYGAPERGPQLRYDITTILTPDVDDLVLKRGLERVDETTMRVTIVVRNIGSDPWDVTVIETLPAGSSYQFGSAAIDGKAAQAIGANPYTFDLGTLNPDDRRVITYRTIAGK